MQLKNKVCLKKKKKIYTYDQLVTLHWRKLRAGIHQGKEGVHLEGTHSGSTPCSSRWRKPHLGAKGGGKAR